MIKLDEHRGFIEPSKGVPSRGFAIRKVANLKLSISNNEKPKIIYLSIFRYSGEWCGSKIEVRLNSSKKIIFKPSRPEITKFEIELKNYNFENTLNLEFKIYPMGIKKLIAQFWALIFKRRQNHLVRDTLLISELTIDKNKILRFEDKERFNYNKSEDISTINLKILGFFSQTFGLAEASRRTLKAIQASKLKYSTTQIPYTGKHNSNEENIPIERSLPIEKNEIRIFHFNGDQLDRLISDWGTSILECKYRIGFWHWELPEFPDDNLPWFNKVDEIWVPSRFVFNSIAPKSNKPVQIIPLALDDQILKPPQPDREKFSIPKNKVVFIITFDFYSILERKNPIAGINVFSKLIESKQYKDHAHLVVKVSNPHADLTGYKLLRETLDKIDNNKVTLIDQVLPRQGILQLINSCDSLISLHRSEGFGLHLAEAMAMGKSVIATNWSGNTDFMNSKNSYLVDYKLVRLKKDFGPYRRNCHWAQPDEDHALIQMKQVLEDEFSNPIKRSKKEIKLIREVHSIKKVASLIEQRIKIINHYLRINRK